MNVIQAYVSAYPSRTQIQIMTNPTPPKPNTQPTTPEAPKAEPSPLADSVAVRAGIVAVRQWMANEGKGKS